VIQYIAAIAGEREKPEEIASKIRQVEVCRYAVTRETFPLTSQNWEDGDVNDQGSTRDTAQIADTSIR
jgi:hypothetical protein